jgi:catechol 2,3-dioxygenase-like lactoylglutathione lyase family enzyme
MIALADVAVTVRDAKASARWWQQVLGFSSHTVGEDGGHSLMVAAPGDRFVLHLCEGFAPLEPGDSGIAFMTDDLEGHVRRMEAAGVSFPEPMRKEAWGGMAKFADPDGNIFWLLGAPTAFVRSEARRRGASASRSAGTSRSRRGHRRTLSRRGRTSRPRRRA